jgi:hypothetical protein
MPGKLEVKVEIDLSGLKEYSRVIDTDLKSRGTGPISRVFKQWAVRYRRFSLKRFNRMASGGWTPLKKQRKRDITAAKRKRKKKARVRNAKILIDSGTLRTALNPTVTSQPGGILDLMTGGLQVGYGGPARHPNSVGSSIAEIAGYHQDGAGSLPERLIIVLPDKSTITAMEGDLARALNKLAKKNTVKE